MNTQETSSRRRFFCKAGIALSAPFAVGAGVAGAAEADPAQARLAELQGITEVREQQRELARRINAGEADLGEAFAGIVRLVPADFGERDSVELAAGGSTARACLHCTVELERVIEGAGSLAQMARAQGNAVAHRTVRRVLVTDHVRHADRWELRAATLADASKSTY